MKDANGRVFQVGDYISGKNRFFVYVVTATATKYILIKAMLSGRRYTIWEDENFTILEPEDLI